MIPAVNEGRLVWMPEGKKTTLECAVDGCASCREKVKAAHGVPSYGKPAPRLHEPAEHGKVS